MRRYLKVFATLLLLSNLGCFGDANNRQIDVAEDVIMNLLPSLNSFGYGLNFSFQSDSLYNCENVGFVYTSKNTSDDISIHLLGVDIPETCLHGTAPAFEKVKIPDADGLYSISIDIGDYIHNTGTLVIENDEYKIYMNDEYGMRIPHQVMYKVPVGTIWGYVVAPNSNNQSEITHQVKDSLRVIADDVDLKEGYYGYFSVAKPVAIYTHFPSYQSAQACFIFHFGEDRIDLENKVEDIRAQLPAGTAFKVFTWEGLEL